MYDISDSDDKNKRNNNNCMNKKSNNNDNNYNNNNNNHNNNDDIRCNCSIESTVWSIRSWVKWMASNLESPRA